MASRSRYFMVAPFTIMTLLRRGACSPGKKMVGLFGHSRSVPQRPTALTDNIAKRFSSASNQSKVPFSRWDLPMFPVRQRLSFGSNIRTFAGYTANVHMSSLECMACANRQSIAFRQAIDNTRDEASQSTGAHRARKVNGAAKPRWLTPPQKPFKPLGGIVKRKLAMAAMLAAVVSCGGPLAAAQDAKPLRIGVFDSRAVALAYGNSDEFRRITRGMRADYDTAKAANNDSRAQELETEGDRKSTRLNSSHL